MDVGDLVVAANGTTVLGIGRIDATGHYRYGATDNFPHRRPVTWLDVEPWTLPQHEALHTTFRKLSIPENLVAIERRIVDARPKAAAPVVAVGAAGAAIPRLTGIAGHIQNVLERKGQVILYGPPGTGKSFWAMRTAEDLASHREFGKPYAVLDASQKSALEARGLFVPAHFIQLMGMKIFSKVIVPKV